MTRAQIEAVLRKHGYFEGHITGSLNREIRTLDTSYQQFVTDFLALAPTPDRDDLERILNNYCVQLVGGGVTSNRFFREELLSWASGTAVKQWCQEIVWTGSQWHITVEAGSLPLGMTGIVPPGWKVCPICSAPRPG